MKKSDSHAKATRTQVRTETTRRAHTDAHTTNDAGLSTLTPLEEKVIRMLHGLSEDDSKALEFAVGASEDARMRLALMEAYNVAELDGSVPLDRAAPSSDAVLHGIVSRFAGRD